jgi:hypothetical protein
MNVGAVLGMACAGGATAHTSAAHNVIKPRAKNPGRFPFAFRFKFCLGFDGCPGARAAEFPMLSIVVFIVTFLLCPLQIMQNAHRKMMHVLLMPKGVLRPRQLA